MQLVSWALGRWLRRVPVKAPATSSWPGAQDQPTGLAEGQGDLGPSLRKLAALPGVERLALLRANGGLFCGRNDGDKEAFSQSVQRVAVAGRQAARRMGLGAIEALVLEGPKGSLVVAAGHSICGAQIQPGADAGDVLHRLAPLAGSTGAEE